MNNNNLGRVAVRTSRRKRNATPLNFDVNATTSVGSIVPLMVREMPADSSISVNTRNLIRLATMVVPTYGRLRLNLRHYFVGMSDLTKNFEALMAEQVISRAHDSFRPERMPIMTKGFLSLMSLIGSHVTLYRNFNSSNDTNTVSTVGLYSTGFSKDSIKVQPSNDVLTFWCAQAYQNTDVASSTYATLNNGQFYTQSMPAAWRSCWNGYSGPALNIAKLIYNVSDWGGTKADVAFWIPIENKDWTTFFNIDKSISDDIPSWYVVNPVDLKSADAVVSIRQRGTALSNGVGQLACRFSSFGQRWFNLLISSGCGVDYADFTVTGYRSLMPLFATYKAYWESFGLELYRKWETSAVVKMMCLFDDRGYWNFEGMVARTARYANGESGINIDNLPPLFFSYWCNFVCDVGTMFYTEEQDFTSAHTRQAVVSPLDTSASYGIGSLSDGTPNSPNVGLRPVVDSSSNEDGTVNLQNAHYPYIMQGNPFSQLDLETLKRLYKVVNRNTIAGQNIAKLLELQGLGSYVSSCKSRFIGEFDVPIDVDEVTATADAFDSLGAPKSLLGEQGAKGVGFGVSKRFKVSANEFGFYICLASIVPEAGYVNTATSTALDTRKYDFYNPEYDGLGMELNAKELTVTAQQDWSDATNAERLSGSSFGFVPRYSRHKVQPNFALGGFALRSERTYYRSFFMDKVIDVGERDVLPIADDPNVNSMKRFQITKLIPVSMVPIASPNWRFVGRYPWLENYLRIFADTGDPRRMDRAFFQTMDPSYFTSLFFDFTFRDEDKFIVQNRFNTTLSAPWLKITDAYETKEDGNVGSTDTSIGKA